MRRLQRRRLNRNLSAGFAALALCGIALLVLAARHLLPHHADGSNSSGSGGQGNEDEGVAQADMDHAAAARAAQARFLTRLTEVVRNPPQHPRQLWSQEAPVFTNLRLPTAEEECDPRLAGGLFLNPCFPVQPFLGLPLLPGGVPERAPSDAAAADAATASVTVGSSCPAMQCPAVFATAAAVSATSLIPAGQQRFLMSSRHRLLLLNSYMRGSVDGWFAPTSAAAFVALSHLQHAAGIIGSVGEIGVHHGLSFLFLASAALQGEALWACDVFEAQSLNLDGSGNGSSFAFKGNLVAHGLDPAGVHIHAASSLSLPADAFCSSSGSGDGRPLPRFRFFSVDGMHTADATAFDLATAACVLAPGGIIAVDDIDHPAWLGVREGVYRFLFERQRTTGSGGDGEEEGEGQGAQDSSSSETHDGGSGWYRDPMQGTSAWAPFLQAGGKLYLTTPSHHALYFGAIARSQLWQSPRRVWTHPHRTLIGGWQVWSESRAYPATEPLDMDSMPLVMEQLEAFAAEPIAVRA